MVRINQTRCHRERFCANAAAANQTQGAHLDSTTASAGETGHGSGARMPSSGTPFRGAGFFPPLTRGSPLRGDPRLPSGNPPGCRAAWQDWSPDCRPCSRGGDTWAITGRVEWRRDRFRPMASCVSALSSIVANGHQVLPTFPPPPLIIPDGEFSPVRLEASLVAPRPSAAVPGCV